MTTPSPMRLNLLRAGYLLLVVGLGLTVWPSILDMGKSWELMHGVVVAMLGAMSLLAVLGLRYPLQMLPLLFFEVAWKAIWLLRVALPLWTSHRLDAGASETAFECSLAVVFLVVIPWPYVFENYIRKGGDPWRVRTEPQRRA
ncbi:MAG: hypothetical protein KGJ79_14865 [Alphaproteobacteria bacterium]|nr:hypothetical protein [Alphaproteobacteria bacterium]